MAKGCVVSYRLGTRFEDYTGTVTDAENAMAVCSNVWDVVACATLQGFIPVSHVTYDFALRVVSIHFANYELLSQEMYLEGDIDVIATTRKILQELLFPALTTSKFVDE